MLLTIFILAVSLFLVVRGAMLATKNASALAESFNLSPYTVGFLIVAVISILPETFIALNAAFSGMSAFGFGMLLGSNVADLTIVFAGIILLTRRALKVECKILESHVYYPLILLVPIVLGLDGHLSRVDGAALMLTGGIFYYIALRHEKGPASTQCITKRTKPALLLFFSMALLLIGAHFTVESASSLAAMLGVTPVLIGMLVVSLGTTLPEFLFSLKAMQARSDALAIGDILGTVLADATIVVGLIALIAPFSFPHVIIYVAGVFMVAAAAILFTFMRSGRAVTQKEAYVLIIFWITFVLIQSIVNIG